MVVTRLAKGHCDYVAPTQASSPVDLKSLPFLRRINWLHTVIIGVPVLVSFAGLAWVPVTWQSAALGFLFYFLGGLGITAGYHRLWSHRSYTASRPVQWVLAVFGAAAFEGSIRWWSRNHRAHHKYSDTDKDPYAVHKGFWYAHLGWMLMKQDTSRVGRADISDLNANPIVSFQHRYYLEIAVSAGFLLPTLIAWIGWGDPLGGLIYGGFFRLMCTQHSTFLVNSAAHTFGSQTFSDEHTGKDNVWTAFLTLGEGYHSYHHEFPHDYRNGIRAWQYDPTKWVIYFLSLFGLTSKLTSYPRAQWEKAKLQMKQRRIQRESDALSSRMKKYDWGPDKATLPGITLLALQKKAETEAKIFVINDGVAHDVTEFADRHPGGRQMLQFWSCRDATAAMNGEVYRHTKNARNMMDSMRAFRMIEELVPRDETREGDGVVRMVSKVLESSLQVK